VGFRRSAVEELAALMSWKEHPVFVTGATGLLGSYLTEELLRRGAQVVCLMRDWVPHSRLLDPAMMSRIHVVRGELEDLTLLLRALNEYEIQTVFHLGAQTIVGTASRSPISTFESNIRGTWNLLEACRLCQKLIQRVVVASSDKAYGAHDQLPYTEDTPLEGRFPYDVSKSCADLISMSYFHTYRTPVCITRCGNLFGGGDFNFNRLIPGTIRSLLADEPPVIRSDGKFVRDYFYVRDAVNAYLQLAENMAREEITGQAFNFGTGTPMTVLEVVNVLLALMNKTHLTPLVLNQASHEILHQFLDSSKAHGTLRWRPAYSFEDALLETIAWYSQFLSGGAVTPLGALHGQIT